LLVAEVHVADWPRWSELAWEAILPLMGGDVVADDSNVTEIT
jgi:hypothetical protein